MDPRKTVWRRRDVTYCIREALHVLSMPDDGCSRPRMARTWLRRALHIRIAHMGKEQREE